MAYKPYNTDIKPGEDMEHYYKRLAKVADQRLLRIQELSGTENFKGIEKFAYAKAQKALDVWGGERFNTKMPESVNLRNEKIADMIHFIQSPTSTKSGIIEVYKKRADTLNQKYGTNLSWQELGKVMESYHNDAQEGSPTFLKAIGVIKDIDKYGVEKALKKNPYMNDDIVMNVVDRYLTNDKYAGIIDSLNLKHDASAVNQMIINFIK